MALQPLGNQVMPLDKEVASNNFRPLFLQPTTSHRNSARLSTLFPRARLRRTSIASDLTLPAPRATHSLRHPCKRLVLENRPADRRNGNQANVCAMAESVHHPTNTYWERRGEWESCRMCAGLQKVTTGRAQPKWGDTGAFAAIGSTTGQPTSNTHTHTLKT